jgi:hypothetical protein
MVSTPFSHQEKIRKIVKKREAIPIQCRAAAELLHFPRADPVVRLASFQVRLIPFWLFGIGFSTRGALVLVHQQVPINQSIRIGEYWLQTPGELGSLDADRRRRTSATSIPDGAVL